MAQQHLRPVMVGGRWAGEGWGLAALLMVAVAVALAQPAIGEHVVVTAHVWDSAAYHARPVEVGGR